MRNIEEIKADILSIDDMNEFPELLAELYLVLKGDIAIDRLEEICNAERDGRCVNLPCTVNELVTMLRLLEKVERDSRETYTTGYRNGYRNGRAQLIRYLLKMPDGVCKTAETAKP